MRALSVLLLATVGCAALETRPSYLPVGAVHGPDTPFPAVPYAPSGDFDKGSVQVMAMDSERLPVGPGAPLLYLHLRLLAENRGDDTPWLFNPNDQILVYDGGLLSPSHAQTSAARPVLALGKGSRGWIDLYYPLPPDADPLRVTLWWRVRHGGAVVPQRTLFVRLTGRDLPVERGYGSSDSALLPGGLALGWWWPDYCFHAGGARRRESYAHPSYARDTGSSSGSSSDSGASSGSSSSSGSGSWRNPDSDSGSSSSSDSSKSAWRR